MGKIFFCKKDVMLFQFKQTVSAQAILITFLDKCLLFDGKR